MFTGELAESRQTEVTIRDIDEVAMELLIDFCYTSQIVVEEANVQTLLPAGEFSTDSHFGCLVCIVSLGIRTQSGVGPPAVYDTVVCYC